jgi:hypothetical protein
MICWLVSGFDFFLSATLGRVFLVLRWHLVAVVFCCASCLVFWALRWRPRIAFVARRVWLF